MIGTGTIGGSISSDNIGVRHLLNRKRVAAQIHDWEIPASGPHDFEIAAWAPAASPWPARARRGPRPGAGPGGSSRACSGPPPPGASLEELVRQAIAAVMRDA